MLSRVLLISSSVNRPADGPPQSNFHVSYHQDATPMSTYNIPKLIIGLVQAIWATSTLYRARGDQIDRYGYAAFGLTVTPYAFMSVLNIIANISNPVYPAVYLIRTPLMDEAETNGGLFQGEIKIESYEQPSTDTWQKMASNMAAEMGIGFLLSLIPLAIVGCLSHFKAQNSTPIERELTMSWLVVGILYGIYLYSAEYLSVLKFGHRYFYLFLRFLCVIFPSAVPTLGGMVVVGKMIHDFGICTLVNH